MNDNENEQEMEEIYSIRKTKKGSINHEAEYSKFPHLYGSPGANIPTLGNMYNNNQQDTPSLLQTHSAKESEFMLKLRNLPEGSSDPKSIGSGVDVTNVSVSHA